MQTLQQFIHPKTSLDLPALCVPSLFHASLFTRELFTQRLYDGFGYGFPGLASRGCDSTIAVA
jgi:hypothetical protein